MNLSRASSWIGYVRVLKAHLHLVLAQHVLGRTVPMTHEVAQALALLKQRPAFTGSHDFVFVSTTGQHLDGSALRRRYTTAQRRAGLRALRFHDLRHTFGSVVINYASPVQVQAWLGHADQRTTARYLNHKHRPGEARLISAAFRVGG